MFKEDESKEVILSLWIPLYFSLDIQVIKVSEFPVESFFFVTTLGNTDIQIV